MLEVLEHSKEVDRATVLGGKTERGAESGNADGVGPEGMRWVDSLQDPSNTVGKGAVTTCVGNARGLEDLEGAMGPGDCDGGTNHT